LRRHHVEHFGDRLADEVEFATATWARLVFDVDAHLNARQMLG
jgi:hypothetical protein